MTSSLKLFQNMWFNSSSLLTIRIFLQSLFRSFMPRNSLFFLLRQFLTLFACQRQSIMSLIPLTKR
uniref:Candidate secreted effector n=1 Tax=Meloidogyne incognita TaxID=6306 RepID=A0A914M3U1_MELIC